MNFYSKIDDLKSKGLIAENTDQLLIAYHNRLSSNGLPVIFNLRHLRSYLKIKSYKQCQYFGKDRGLSYNTFTIPKKTGGYRTIEAPNKELKIRQNWVKTNILEKFNVSIYATGFKKNCSILDNAKYHCNKKYVLNIDIKDFFPSITYGQIFRLYLYMGYTREVSHLLTQLCTNSHNVLPQGAPTSPYLSNLVNLKLDKRLSSFAKKINANYSRYADDITISCNTNPKRYLQIIKKIITEEGYTINDKKTRIQHSGEKQMVTGLVVNRKVSVPKKLKKELDNAIYFINKYGLANHMEYIECNYAFYKEHLYGIAYFIKMIEPAVGIQYLQKLDNLQWFY